MSEPESSQMSLTSLRKSLKEHVIVHYRRQVADLQQLVTLGLAEQSNQLLEAKYDATVLGQIGEKEKSTAKKLKELKKNKTLSKRMYKIKVKELHREVMMETIKVLDEFESIADNNVEIINKIKKNKASEGEASVSVIEAEIVSAVEHQSSSSAETKNETFEIADPSETTGAFIDSIIESLKMHNVPVERMNLPNKD